MKYSILEKKLKEIDRRKLRQFEIKTKFRLMKALTGGNEKYRHEYNRINKINEVIRKEYDKIIKKSYWHIISYMT